MTWRRADDVAFVGDDERVVLLDLTHLDRPPLILEGSSALIWALLSEAPSEDALLHMVAEHYAVSLEEVEGPVRAFLRDLRDRSLIHPGEPA